jgi:uncharacterized protein YijF (DUF1287 family)
MFSIHFDARMNSMLVPFPGIFLLALIAYIKFQQMSLPLPLKCTSLVAQLHRNVVGVTVLLNDQYSILWPEMELSERTGVCALRHYF